MADYNITMKQKNDQGDYDNLYPKTIGSQVEGITSSQITGQFPASQINDIYTKEQTLTQIIAQLFNLNSGDAVPNDIFNILSKAILVNNDNNGLILPNGNELDSGKVGMLQMEIGNYFGTGQSYQSLSFNFEPRFVAIIAYVDTANQVSYKPIVAFFTKDMSSSYQKYVGRANTHVDYAALFYDTVTQFQFNGNIISWHNMGQSGLPLNKAQTYHYIAIG